MSFASTDTSYTWENLGEGTYIFWVELVDVDGESLMPPVIAAALLTVTVEPEETTVPAQTTTPAAATTSPAATTPEETEMP